MGKLFRVGMSLGMAIGCAASAAASSLYCSVSFDGHNATSTPITKPVAFALAETPDYGGACFLKKTMKLGREHRLTISAQKTAGMIPLKISVEKYAFPGWKHLGEQDFNFYPEINEESEWKSPEGDLLVVTCKLAKESAIVVVVE